MMYESDYDRKYDNEFDCGPPPNFNIPPPPRADFVELYKCSENAMNDYGLCGAITIIDAGLHNGSSTQTSAMILLGAVLLLIFAFISSIVIWNHKRKSQVFLSSSHKGANNGSRSPDSNIMTLPSTCLDPDIHNRTFMRQHPLGVEMSMAKPLRYQISHPPPLFICSSPGPDPYRSHENVYEELQHDDGDAFVLCDRQITSDDEFPADASSLPGDRNQQCAGSSSNNSTNDISESHDYPRSSFNRSNDHHRITSSSGRRQNFNTCSKLLRLNAENFVNRSVKGKQNNPAADSFNMNILRSHEDAPNHHRTDHRTLDNYNLNYPAVRSYTSGSGNVMSGDMMMVEPELSGRKVNDSENVITSRKSGKNNSTPAAATFSEFEMQYHPTKVNSNFYVPSHDIMTASRRNIKYKTADNRGRNQAASVRRNQDYFYKAPQQQNNFTYDQYNNNSGNDVEIYQQPDIMAEFSNLQTFNNCGMSSPNHPIYNNSTALSSDSGYSQNTQMSEGTLESQSKRSSNGNIFILPATNTTTTGAGATSNSNQISHITDSYEMT